MPTLDLITFPSCRYKNVFAESQNPDANWAPQVHEKSKAEVDRITAALNANKFSDLFQSFSDSEMEKFISYMEKEEIAAGTDIMTQGDDGDYFYVSAPAAARRTVASTGRRQLSDDRSRLIRCRLGGQTGTHALCYSRRNVYTRTLPLLEPTQPPGRLLRSPFPSCNT